MKMVDFSVQDINNWNQDYRVKALELLTSLTDIVRDNVTGYLNKIFYAVLKATLDSESRVLLKVGGL
jgi:hypothetical protein